QMREALDDLGEALDDHVDPTAVVAGEPAQEQSERERERDTDQADGERDAGGIDDAAEHVAAQPVGAQPEELPALGGTDEMEAALDQTPEFVTVTQAEEPQRLRPGRVGRVDALQRFHVARGLERVDERPEELALVEQMDL